MTWLAYAVTTLNRRMFHAAKWLVYVIVGCMIVEVVSRYFFDSPTTWAPELATMLFGVYFLLGGPHLLHLGGHVSVDLVSASAGRRTALALRLVSALLAVCFATILTWYALPLAWDAFVTGETSYTSWAPVIWPVKASLPLATALLGLQALADAYLLLTTGATGEGARS